MLDSIVKDMQSYQLEMAQTETAEQTNLLLDILEKQQMRTEEEWRQGGGFNNEEALRRLQEAWAEEDKMVAEALKLAEEEVPDYSQTNNN